MITPPPPALCSGVRTAVEGAAYSAAAAGARGGALGRRGRRRRWRCPAAGPTTTSDAPPRDAAPGRGAVTLQATSSASSRGPRSGPAPLFGARRLRRVVLDGYRHGESCGTTRVTARPPSCQIWPRCDRTSRSRLSRTLRRAAATCFAPPPPLPSRLAREILRDFARCCSS